MIMEKQHIIKGKLELLNNKYIGQFCTDFIKECYKDIEGQNHTDISDEQYGRYAKRIVDRIKAQLSKQLRKEEVVKHIDLEDMIAECKKKDEEILKKGKE